MLGVLVEPSGVPGMPWAGCALPAPLLNPSVQPQGSGQPVLLGFPGVQSRGGGRGRVSAGLEARPDPGRAAPCSGAVPRKDLQAAEHLETRAVAQGSWIWSS